MSQYSQRGGATRMPNRFYNAGATAFRPACQSCGLPKKEPTSQNGGAITMPYRWFNEGAEPFNPAGSPACGGCGCQKCGCGKDGKGCGCGAKQNGGAYDYYNDFGKPCGQGYNSSNMTHPGVNGERAKQRGGNPSGAPLYVFTPGQPLPQHYPVKNGPAFDKVGKNKFWCNKY